MKFEFDGSYQVEVRVSATAKMAFPILGAWWVGNKRIFLLKVQDSRRIAYRFLGWCRISYAFYRTWQTVRFLDSIELASVSTPSCVSLALNRPPSIELSVVRICPTNINPTILFGSYHADSFNQVINQGYDIGDQVFV